MAQYQEIHSTEELAEALKSREEQSVLFFKHSNSCGISTWAFAEFERYLESPESRQVRNCVIIVQTARAASDELARLTGVEHESPQAIVVRQGRAVWNDSHMAIKRDALAEVVSKTEV